MIMESQTQEESHQNKLGNIIVVILVLAALVLGYFLYQKMILGKASNIDPNEFPALSADEQAVLNPPPSGASQAERDAHFALVERTAVQTQIFKIGPQCQIAPVVLKIRKGEMLTLKNYDAIPHTIAMPDDNQSFQVPANGQRIVPAEFGARIGVYGYICDASNLAGMILVYE